MKKSDKTDIIIFSVLGTVLFIVIIIFLVSRPKDYQVSNLNVKDGYFIGVFKNNSDKECKDVKIIVSIKSGSFEEEENIYLENVEPEDTEDIHNICLKCGELENDNIKVKVNEIVCE